MRVNFSSEETLVSGPSEVAKRGSRTVILKKATIKVKLRVNTDEK